MCIIKNGNDEDVKFDEGMFLEVIEHYYKGKLISYNLMLEEELIESYDEEEIAVFAMQEVSRLIDKGKKYIDMQKVNLIIEA